VKTAKHGVKTAWSGVKTSGCGVNIAWRGVADALRRCATRRCSGGMACSLQKAREVREVFTLLSWCKAARSDRLIGSLGSEARKIWRVHCDVSTDCRTRRSCSWHTLSNTRRRSNTRHRTYRHNDARNAGPLPRCLRISTKARTRGEKSAHAASAGRLGGWESASQQCQNNNSTKLL
jgi:hypothetical protein